MDKTARITRLVLPGHTNRHGSLFGGIALSLMDEAAGIVSTRVARGPVVTAHIESTDVAAEVEVQHDEFRVPRLDQLERGRAVQCRVDLVFGAG